MREKNIMEDITIYDILKNAPKGVKLYSPLFGEVEFIKVVEGSDRQIEVCGTDDGPYYRKFNEFGQFYSYKTSECLLFPSKDCRNWDSWQRILFKPGDILFSEHDDYEYYLFESWESFITITGKRIKDPRYIDYLDLEYATKEERKTFMEKLEENGYTWTSSSGLVETSGEPKFKISDLKPFDRVLVRDLKFSTCPNWECALYSHYDDSDAVYHYVTLGGVHFELCVPYNEETKDLLNTNKDYDGKYKTW